MTNKAKCRQALEERNKALNLLAEVLSYAARGVSVPKTLVEDCEGLRRNASLKPSAKFAIMPPDGILATRIRNDNYQM